MGFIHVLPLASTAVNTSGTVADFVVDGFWYFSV